MAETEIVKIINIKTNQAIESVRELKQYCSELTDDLVKLNKGSEEYDKTLEELSKSQAKLIEVQRDAKNAVDTTETSYRALNQELVRLKNEYRNYTAEQRANNDVGGATLKRIQELDTELKKIDEDMGQSFRKVGSYEQALKSLNGVFTNQKKELAALKTAMDNLDPSTEEYASAFQRAAEITHNLSERQTQLKYASPDLGDQLSNIRGIASNMVAGFSALNAAMGLFGQENEDVQKAMLKVQQAMAIVQGMQGLEGLWKRTEGLSTSMKAWIGASKQATVATNAQTTATAAETVATEAQTVATETETVAQKGLNAAMKANPIGVIVTAVMAAVTVFTLFGKKIKELVQGNEKLNNIWTKMKAVIAATATAIKNYFMLPIKEAINYVKTLGKVLYDVFTLNWKEIGNDIREGAKEAVDMAKEAGEQVGDAYNNSIAESNTRAQRRRAAARAEELQEIIKDNEAKLGSDWKYTEEGIKIYREYYANLLGQYKKDTSDYKEAQREKWKYENDLSQKQQQQQKTSGGTGGGKTETAAEQRAKAEKAYYSQVQKIVGVTTKEVLNSYNEQLTAAKDYYKSLSKTVKDSSVRSAIEDYVNQLDTYIKQFNDKATEFDLITVSLLNGISSSELRNISNTFSTDLIKYINEQWREKGKDIRIGDVLKEAVDKGIISAGEVVKYRTQIEFNRLQKQFDALITDAIANSSSNANRKLNDQIIKLYQTSLKPTVAEVLTQLQNDLDSQTLSIDIDLATNGENLNGDNAKAKEIERTNLIYENAVKQIQAQIDFYQKTIDFVNQNGLIPSDAYDDAVLKIEALKNKLKELDFTHMFNIGEINKRYFDNEIAELDNEATEALRKLQNDFTKKNNTGSIWNIITPTSLTEEKEQLEQEYNIQLEHLNKVKGLWEQRALDQNLSNEERLEAEQKIADLSVQIQDTELQKEADIAAKRAEIFQQWVGGVSEAVGQIANLIGSLADIYEKDLEAKVKNNEMSEKEADEVYENIKAMRIAEVVINTIAGSIGAFLQASATYPPPYGQIIGGISAAAATAAGIAQIANIKGQSRSSSSVSSASVSAPQTGYDFNPSYVRNMTGEQDVDTLRNAVSEGMGSANIVVSVTDINNVQNKVKVTESESNF